VKNPKPKNSLMAMSKESTMMMGEYIIDLKAIFYKKRSISDCKLLRKTLSHMFGIRS